MKIEKLETLRLAEFPNLVWVRLHTDAGLAGLGGDELCRAIGRNLPARVHRAAAARQGPPGARGARPGPPGLFGYRSSGVETRAISAVDIALWDLFGKACAQPLYQMLGGASRPAIRTYNTCAGYRYIRDARLPAAQRIARALAEFDTYRHEDPIRMDSLELLKQYAPHSKAPICASEILAGRWAFKDLLETGVAGIVMFDLAWCGGITEARRIAALADAWQLPVAPHDCVGPVVYAASCHFSIWCPNALVQESVRAFYTGWYNELVTQVPKPVRGMIAAPPGPGLGCELLPEVWKRADASVRVSPA